MLPIHETSTFIHAHYITVNGFFNDYVINLFSIISNVFSIEHFSVSIIKQPFYIVFSLKVVYNLVMNFWVRLETCKKDLSPSEMKVCKILEEDPTPFHFFSASKIAQDYGIPQASITRFVQRLGFNSYSDFRMALVTSETKHAYQEPITSEKQIIECASAVRELASKTLLDILSHHIINAHHVFMAGTGNAHIQAYQMMIKLANIGIPSTLIQPGFETQTLRVMNNQDVVILYSHMLPTHKSFLEAANDLPKEERPFIVLIYSKPNHPLRKYVDLPIELPTFNTANTISQANEFPPVMFNLYLIEHLVEILRSKHK